MKRGLRGLRDLRDDCVQNAFFAMTATTRSAQTHVAKDPITPLFEIESDDESRGFDSDARAEAHDKSEGR